MTRPDRFSPTGGYAGNVARAAAFLLVAPVLLARELPGLWRAWKAWRGLPKTYTVEHVKREAQR